VAVVVVGGYADVVRAFLVRLLSLGVKGYQGFIRPWLPPLCRYQPTCSEYALEALRLHGPFRGSLLASKRICRCHPFHPGGHDPVPLPPAKEA
jgi:putative membrane protein insertion efficiency factor